MASYSLVDVGRPTGQRQWADRLFVVALGMVAATTMEPIPSCQRRRRRRRKKRTLPSLSLTQIAYDLVAGARKQPRVLRRFSAPSRAAPDTPINPCSSC